MMVNMENLIDKLVLVEAYGKNIAFIAKGSKIIWEAIRSCFGKGLWVNDKPWSNKDGWKNK